MAASACKFTNSIRMRQSCCRCAGKCYGCNSVANGCSSNCGNMVACGWRSCNTKMPHCRVSKAMQNLYMQIKSTPFCALQQSKDAPHEAAFCPTAASTRQLRQVSQLLKEFTDYMMTLFVVLALAQCFSLMPVQGIWASSVRELHFTWSHWCAWYSFCCICITSLDTLFVINMAAHGLLDVRGVGEIQPVQYRVYLLSYV